MTALKTSALLLSILSALATGCAGPDNADPAEAGCRRAAYDDPDVKDAVLRSNSQMQQVRGPALMELDQLLRQKTRQCLAVSGRGPPGGVEPVKPN